MRVLWPAFVVVALSFTAGVGAHAQAAAPGGAEYYPSRQLRLVVPFPPGGSNDTLGRIIAQGLGESLWQTVLVDNRGGNSGIDGADLVAKAAPDGLHLARYQPQSCHHTAMFSNLPYDALKNIVPVSIYGREAYALIIHPGVKAKTVKELLDLARATPGGLIYGSAGRGGAPHLAVEVLKLAAQVPMTHVP